MADHIFISYSREDSHYAYSLASALENEGFEVWIDKHIEYGAKWIHVIQERIESCTAFIVIMTPNARKAEWVTSELAHAKDCDKPIFPLLLEGKEPWIEVKNRQFLDVKDRSLPPKKFYEQLAEVAPRKIKRDSASISLEERQARRKSDSFWLKNNGLKTQVAFIVLTSGVLLVVIFSLPRNNEPKTTNGENETTPEFVDDSTPMSHDPNIQPNIDSTNNPENSSRLDSIKNGSKNVEDAYYTVTILLPHLLRNASIIVNGLPATETDRRLPTIAYIQVSAKDVYHTVTLSDSIRSCVKENVRITQDQTLAFTLTDCAIQ